MLCACARTLTVVDVSGDGTEALYFACIAVPSCVTVVAVRYSCVAHALAAIVAVVQPADGVLVVHYRRTVLVREGGEHVVDDRSSRVPGDLAREPRRPTRPACCQKLAIDPG